MKIHAQMHFMLGKYYQISPCLALTTRVKFHRWLTCRIKLSLTMIPQGTNLDRENRQRLTQSMNR